MQPSFIHGIVRRMPSRNRRNETANAKIVPVDTATSSSTTTASCTRYSFVAGFISAKSKTPARIQAPILQLCGRIPTPSFLASNIGSLNFGSCDDLQWQVTDVSKAGQTSLCQLETVRVTVKSTNAQACRRSCLTCLVSRWFRPVAAPVSLSPGPRAILSCGSKYRVLNPTSRSWAAHSLV